MKKKLFVGLAIVMFLIVGTVCSVNATAITFSDDFEAQSFDPFWADIYQDYGTVTLSSDQAHSGTQSAKFSSTSGGQRWVWLSHKFSEVISGEVSVWFYDITPNQNNLYSSLTLYNSTVTWGEPGYIFSLGIMDFNRYNYYSTSPSSTGGTPVLQRTLGWHEFKITTGSTGGQMFIDDTLVNSYTGDHGFDSVYLTLSGPYWRPNATYYFDDFSITTSAAPVPEPATILLLGTGLVSMAGVMRRKTKK